MKKFSKLIGVALFFCIISVNSFATITVLPTRNEYTATVGQTTFFYTFKIFADTDLNVYVTPSGQEPNDTTDIVTPSIVGGVGDTAGGTITIAATSAGDLVTIVSDIPENREVDYQNNGSFRPTTVNNDFDRVVSLTKQILDTASRTLLFPQSQQNAKELSLPPPVAGLYMRWKTDETGLENTGAPSVTAPAISHSSVLDMQGSATLVVGDVVQTAAYYSTRDGGEALYVIVAAGTGISNGGTYIDLPGSGLQARLLADNTTFMQWGAYETNTNNESFFIAANTWCTANNQTLIIDANTTFITKPVNVTCDIAGKGTLQLLFEYDISGDTSATGQAIDWTCRYGLLYLKAEVIIKDITIDANNSGGALSGNGADNSQLLGVTFINGARGNTFIIDEADYLFWKCISKDSGLGGNDTAAHQEENTWFGDSFYNRSCHDFRFVFCDISEFSRNGIVSEGDASSGVSTNPRLFGNHIHDHSGGNLADFAGYWQENTQGGDVSHNTISGMKSATATDQAFGISISGISVATQAHPSYDIGFSGGEVAHANIITDSNCGIMAAGPPNATVNISENDIRDYHRTGMYILNNGGVINIKNNTFGSRTDQTTGDKEFTFYRESAATGFSNAFILCASAPEQINIIGNTFKSTNFQNGCSHVQMSNFAAFGNVKKLYIENNVVEPWTIEVDATEQHGLSIEAWSIHEKLEVKNQDLWIGNNTAGVKLKTSIKINDCTLYQDGDYGNPTMYAPDIKIIDSKESFITGGLSRFLVSIGNLESVGMNFDFSGNEVVDAISIICTEATIATLNNNKLRNSDYALYATVAASTSKTYCSGNLLENHVNGGWLVELKDASDQLILIGNIRDDANAIYFNNPGATVQEINTLTW